MEPLAMRLRSQGFDARTFGYASMSTQVPDVAEELGAVPLFPLWRTAASAVPTLGPTG